MQLKLTTIINSITLIAAAFSVVGAVALPEADADKRQFCNAIPVGGKCLTSLSCCFFPENICLPSEPGVNRCQPAPPA